MDFSKLSNKPRSSSLKNIPSPGLLEGGVAINKDLGLKFKTNNEGPAMESNKNNLAELNKLLFEQLDRLSNVELTSENLSLEINRSNALAGLSCQVVSVGNLAIKARTTIQNNLPKMLEE